MKKTNDSKTFSASSSLTLKKQSQVKQQPQAKDAHAALLDNNSLRTFDNGHHVGSQDHRHHQNQPQHPNTYFLGDRFKTLSAAQSS